MYLSSHAQTHRGTVRVLNEDALLELPKLNLWVVADGMGGHAAGDVASQLVVDTIENQLLKLPINKITKEEIIGVIKLANTRLQNMIDTHFAGKVAGSTVVVLWIYNNQFHYFWVGDSRGYLQRADNLTQITKDHSQVNDMVDEGILDSSEAETHPLANVITRAVGVDEEVEVDYISGALLPNDIFLLCSDGLNKEVSNEEIESTATNGRIIDVGLALMHAALVRDARDNVTYILVKANIDNTQADSQSCDATIPLFK